jgi:hypothetical protein
LLPIAADDDAGTGVAGVEDDQYPLNARRSEQ